MPFFNRVVFSWQRSSPNNWAVPALEHHEKTMITITVVGCVVSYGFTRFWQFQWDTKYRGDWIGNNRVRIDYSKLQKIWLVIVFELLWISMCENEPSKPRSSRKDHTSSSIFQKNIRLNISPKSTIGSSDHWETRETTRAEHNRDWFETSQKLSTNANFPTTFLGFSEATIQHVNEIDSQASRFPNNS